MRKIYFALVAFLMTTSMQVMAEDNNGDYNRIELGWSMNGFDSGNSTHGESKGDNPMLWTSDFDGLYFGIRAGYLHGFKLSKSNFYLETGAQLSYLITDTETESGSYKKTADLFSAAVPVNFAYKFQFTNCFIQPYVGVNARYNIAASVKIDDLKRDMFNEKEAYYGTFNRFQWGGQVGFRVGFKHITLHCEVQKLSKIATLDKNVDPGKTYNVSHVGTWCMGIAYAF